VRVFVTGGGLGFVGAHVVTALESAGHDVVHDWIDVRDGPALERAVDGCEAVLRAGERYLLGAVNLTLAEVFALIAKAAGRRPPRVELPYAAARALAAVGLANRNEVALARLPAWFDSAKATRELGYEPGPLEPALERAVRA
jgi:nucleoside-diphosphate-sugar epimerase